MQLPVEIILLIISHLPSWEIKKLSLVDKRMRALCIPSLFRSVRVGFSRSTLGTLMSLTSSALCERVTAFTYVAPQLLKSDVTNFDFFKSSMLTPESYVEVAKSQADLGFRPSECAPYMAIFQTVQNMGRKQNQILENRIDQAALSKALCVFPRLKELTVHFCVPLERKPWLEAYIDHNTDITEGLYTHHIQVIAQALSDRSKWGLDQVDSIHFRGFQIQAGHQYEISDLMSLSAHLQKLLVGVRSLKMTQSESAMEVLSQWDLNIDELDMCDMMIDYDTLKRFFSANQPTLRSIGFHNVVVTEVPFEESASQLSVDILSELIGARRRAQGQATYCHCHSRHNGWRIFWEKEPLVPLIRHLRSTINVLRVRHLMDPKIERRKALQRRNRRMKSLLLKAVDMSILCDAEIVLGIRIRETGRVTTFCSDPEGLWSPATLQLRNYYPIPVNMTLDDFQHGQHQNKDQGPEPVNDEAGRED